MFKVGDVSVAVLKAPLSSYRVILEVVLNKSQTSNLFSAALFILVNLEPLNPANSTNAYNICLSAVSIQDPMLQQPN